MTTSISTHSFDSKQYDTTIDCSSKIEPTTDCSIINDSHVLNEDLDFFESKYNYKSDSHGAKDYFIAEFESKFFYFNLFLKLILLISYRYIGY